MRARTANALWNALSDVDSTLFLRASAAPRIPGAYRRKMKRFLRIDLGFDRRCLNRRATQFTRALTN